MPRASLHLRAHRPGAIFVREMQRPMNTTAGNGKVLERWFAEVWNKGKESTIYELFAPDGISQGWAEKNPSAGLMNSRRFSKR